MTALLDELFVSQVCTDCGVERPMDQFPIDYRCATNRAKRCTPCRERACAQCGVIFYARSRNETAQCCSTACARKRRLDLAGGCGACALTAAPCDDHQSPPVCVCDAPRFDGPCNCERVHVPDECRACHRPYAPVFAALREAWRTHLQETR